jgi:hypothetical protein
MPFLAAAVSWFTTNRLALELAAIIGAVCIGSALWVAHDDTEKAKGVAQAEAVAAKQTAADAVRDAAAAKAAQAAAQSTLATAQASAKKAQAALSTSLTKASNEDASLSACLSKQLPADVLSNLPN